MLLERPLATVTPSVDGDVLAVLAVAEAAFTPAHVQRLMDRHSVPGTRKALNRLAEQGVVEVNRAGNAYMYRLNREHLASGAIIELASLRAVLYDRIRTAVLAWEVPAILVMLFGSAATRNMRPDSDIDIFVLGDTTGVEDESWRTQIADLQRSVTKWTGNDARVLQYSLADLGHGRDPVIDEIRRHGVRIVGDEAMLRPSRNATG
jgi:predicted nucleotidyltransferase